MFCSHVWEPRGVEFYGTNHGRGQNLTQIRWKCRRCSEIKTKLTAGQWPLSDLEGVHPDQVNAW